MQNILDIVIGQDQELVELDRNALKSRKAVRALLFITVLFLSACSVLPYIVRLVL